MACDPRCLCWYSDDPHPGSHDARGSDGRSRRHLPDDAVAEGRRDNAHHRASRQHSRNGTRR